MRGIILAAGRGSRMGVLSVQRPKPLTLLAGRPMLEWQLLALRAAGLSEIAVVRGYLGHLLPGGTYRAFDNPRWAETNMVGSLVCASEWLEDGACLVSYADIVFHPDAARTLMASDAPLAITYDRRWRELWTARFADPLRDAETFRVGPEGRLLEIGKRPATLDEVQGQYMGLLRFTPQGWAQVRTLLREIGDAAVDRLDMTSLLGRLLQAGIPVTAVGVEGRWCEVDTAADLGLYEAKVRERNGWSHDWRW